MIVFTFKKGELIHRTSRDPHRARSRPVERHAIQHRALAHPVAATGPLSRPYINGFRRDVEHASRRTRYRCCFALEIASGKIADSHGVECQTVVGAEG